MNPWLMLGIGVLAGFALHAAVTQDSTCCATVKRGVEAKTGLFGPLLSATGLSVPIGNALG